MRGWKHPLSFLPRLAVHQRTRREFQKVKPFNIFSLARALGKLHKKILKTFYSLCILPIAILNSI